MPWHKVDMSSVGDTEVLRIFLRPDASNLPHILLIVFQVSCSQSQAVCDAARKYGRHARRVRTLNSFSASCRGSFVAACEEPLYFFMDGRDGSGMCTYFSHLHPLTCSRGVPKNETKGYFLVRALGRGFMIPAVTVCQQ